MSRRQPMKAADQLDDAKDRTPIDDIEVILEDGAGEGAEPEITRGERDVSVEGGDLEAGDRETEADPLAVLKSSHDAHKAELERERRDRIEAQNRARDAETRAQQSEATARNATDVAIENALLVTRQNIENAAAAVADAARRNDWDGYSKAQAQLAENNAYLNDLRNKKNEFEAQAKKQAPQNDGIEAYIASRTPESQKWLRDHYDDVFLNPQKGALAQAADRLAIAKGIVPDTPEYFDFIDSQMGYKKVETREKSPQQAAKKNGAPAAPASRSSFGTPASGSKTQVRLTLKQREYAESLRPDLPSAEAWKVYAAGVAEIDSGKSHLQWSKDRYK
jgi:hypothetical protein